LKIFDGVDVLQRGLGASWKRNSIILNNVANVDTPGYKASEMNFESFFRDEFDNDSGFQHTRTRETHMAIPAEYDNLDGMVTTSDTVERMDGNNVDIDKETTDFAKNVIFYNTLIRKVSGQLTQLQTAIRGQ
jgi:flagellar basal-body rod protein FlgB